MVGEPAKQRESKRTNKAKAKAGNSSSGLRSPPYEQNRAKAKEETKRKRKRVILAKGLAFNE